MDIGIGPVIKNASFEFDGNVVHGNIELFGAWHHVRLIRVREDEMVQPFDGVDPQVKEWFDDMQKFWDGAYERCTVPGLPGKYVMFIFPCAV